VVSSTVSRALNDYPDIKQSTKERIRKIAKEIQYSPNPISRSLKSNHKMTIGVIVPEIKHDFFTSAISGIEEIAFQSGYNIMVCQSNESYEQEVINTSALMHHRVAGIIVSISQNTKSGKHFQDLLRRKMPLVFFDRVCDAVPASKVVIDDCNSAHNAVRHLIQRGYKYIAHFGGPKELSISVRRLNGYVEALKESEISLRPEFVLYGGLHEENGYNSMDCMLRQKVMVDAVFAVNDPVAIGAIQRVKESGLKIPSDIAIVGFSDSVLAPLMDPPLTTVHQPSFEMGTKAAKVLIDGIENGVTYPRTFVLDTRLIVRGST
jgi:DNA-binding LacI/PurR family transcriptional regulator